MNALDDTLVSGPAAVNVVDTEHHVNQSGRYDVMDIKGHIAPTEHELATLPKVAGTMPVSAYLLCAVEFAERASYYGCKQVFKNFIRGPLPVGGNGAGAPPKGSQKTAGALGKGTVIASAMTDAFTFLAYGLPIFGGWLSDAHLGRFKTICIGVAICGVAHIIMVISAIPSVIQAGKAIGPFALSLYMLAIGAALFKANIAPTVLDQNPHKKPHVITNKDGSKAIVDPEATSESIMLWFYLLVNVGGFFGVATSYLAKDVGFYAAYLLPCIVYLMLPVLLYFVNPRLIKFAPGGSALGNFIKVIFLSLKKAGIRGFGRKGFFERAKPSVLAASGDSRVVTWDDDFVEDVRRTMGACAIFLFFPIQQINDGGLGAAGNAQSAALTTNGVPNDLLDNLNPLAIIVLIPILNHGIYPLLRKLGIRFGPIKRMTFGLFVAAIGASAYAIIQHYVYKTSPCGDHASDCEIGSGVSSLSVWLYGIPTLVTATSEVFINVTAYGVAYSRAPQNMKGFVMALSLFMQAITTAISLATANAIQDPYLVWVFAVPSIIGFVSAFVFWFLFKHLDNEEFFVHVDDAVPIPNRSLDEEHSSIDEKHLDRGIDEKHHGAGDTKEVKL
ncbi:putative Peptide transporter PTR2 [Glarea lozoyensis 74030]|uniref:Putative Peptide transporter PTR2 n=1 Tax=Glarea lozoyensis (strain ATCC 74030 / MF5533) TaxID=1104152 RepID=H0EZG9_GLAL7|nr:putative Peptide transporter PTR2 [Glarea lozoyensis 74030]